MTNEQDVEATVQAAGQRGSAVSAVTAAGVREVPGAATAVVVAIQVTAGAETVNGIEPDAVGPVGQGGLTVLVGEPVVMLVSSTTVNVAAVRA